MALMKKSAPRMPLVPELLEALADALLHLPPHLGVLPHRLARALATDHVDGGGEGSRLLGAQPGLHLRVDGPGGRHVKAGVQQGLEDRLPGGGGLVGEDDDGDAVGLEDPMDLAEGLGEHLLKAAPGLLHPACLARISHHLLGLGSEGGREQLRMEVADGALEPDVEEVREVAVGHVVVVGGVGDDGVEVVVGIGELGGGALATWGKSSTGGMPVRCMKNVRDRPSPNFPNRLAKRVQFHVIPHHWQCLAGKNMQ
jgi:hypothetical protein